MIAVNQSLEDTPEIVNSSPYGDGWFFKMQPDNLGDVQDLMDVNAYEAFCEDEDH